MATTALIIGALATAGSAAYSANQSKKATQAGGIPQAAEYKPIEFGEEQIAGIIDNTAALPYIDHLLQGSTSLTLQNDIRRAKKLIPGYKGLLQQQSSNTAGLLRGELPYDDVLGIISKRAGLAGQLGTPGTAGGSTLKDLGLSRLDAMKTGSSMFSGMVDIAEKVSPISRYLSPSSQLVSPTDRIRLAMEQNQLIQQSDQNRNNLAAGISPTKLAQNAATLSGANNPYAGIGPAIGAIGGALASPDAFGGQPVGGGAGGDFSRGAGMSMYSNGFYTNPAAAGYAPAGASSRIASNPYGLGYYSDYDLALAA